MPSMKSVSDYFQTKSVTPSQIDANVVRVGNSRIQNATSEFEATFLSLIVKELRQTEEPEGLFAGDSGDVLGGLFDQLMGQHLASAGGVGLAAELSGPLGATETTIRRMNGYGNVSKTPLQDELSRRPTAGVASS